MCGCLLLRQGANACKAYNDIAAKGSGNSRYRSRRTIRSWFFLAVLPPALSMNSRSQDIANSIEWLPVLQEKGPITQQS